MKGLRHGGSGSRGSRTQETQSDTAASSSFSTSSQTESSAPTPTTTTDEQRESLRAESAVTGINPKDLIGAKKVPLGLIPPNSLLELALAMADGAGKYGPFNWRETPIQAQTYLEAGMGHFLAVLDGQDIDPVSKVHHLAHAMACAAIYMDAQKIGTLVDNRPTVGKTGQGLFSRNPTETLSYTLSHSLSPQQEEAHA
jgi:hypothetical protein